METSYVVPHRHVRTEVTATGGVPAPHAKRDRTVNPVRLISRTSKDTVTFATGGGLTTNKDLRANGLPAYDMTPATCTSNTGVETEGKLRI